MRVSRLVNYTIRATYHYLEKGKAMGYIFTLHRVNEIDPDRLMANESMKISPLFLDRFLSKYKDKYEYISLCDVPQYIQSKRRKRFMAFTMDDGYKDNYTNALPIFQKHNVPFTIFVSTDFPDYKAILWWYVLEDYLLDHDTVTLRDGTCLSAKTKEEKERTFMYVRSKILNLDQLHLLEGLKKLFVEELQWTGKCEELAMSWDDIKSCASNHIVTIGGHTKHHYNLKKLASKDEIRDEVLYGCERLYEKANIKPVVFAYPFGSKREISNREVNVVSALGFNLACVSGGGYCGVRSKNMYALPRIMLTEQFREDEFI